MEKKFNIIERVFDLVNKALLTQIFLIDALEPDILDFGNNEKDFFQFLLNGKGYARYQNIIFFIDFVCNNDVICIYFGKDKENFDGNYNFLIQKKSTLISFINHHRWLNVQRRKGIGTIHLKKIESIFKRLGESVGKNIRIEFVMVENQADTKAWLSKNGYKKIGVGYFIKKI